MILDELITNRTSGATYGADDLNRVAEAVEYAADLLYSVGYPSEAAKPLVRNDWQSDDIFYFSNGADMIAALDILRENVGAFSRNYPDEMDGLTYSGANAIERFFLLTAAAIAEIAAEWIWQQCGAGIQSGGALI